MNSAPIERPGLPLGKNSNSMATFPNKLPFGFNCIVLAAMNLQQSQKALAVVIG